MGKRKKDSMKRAARRERAKLKGEGTGQDEAIAQEQAADERVENAATAEIAAPLSREKKGPKPAKEEETENAWERIKGFISEVKIEARKINWPAVDDTWKSTGVTIIFIVALSLFMGVASIGFQKVSEALFTVNTSTYTTPPVEVGAETPATDETGTETPVPVPDPTIPVNPLEGE